MGRQYIGGALSLADEISEEIRLSSPADNGIANNDTLKRLLAEREVKDACGL